MSDCDFFVEEAESIIIYVFSKFFPFWFVLRQLYIMLWLLKSPSRIKGVGSCCNILLSSFSFIAS